MWIWENSDLECTEKNGKIPSPGSSRKNPDHARKRRLRVF
jgi:hypothetical protein